MEPPKILLSDQEGMIFEIEGDSGYVHLVSFDRENGWFCSCEDYGFRKRFCKHMKACAEVSKIESREVWGAKKNG